MWEGQEGVKIKDKAEEEGGHLHTRAGPRYTQQLQGRSWVGPGRAPWARARREEPQQHAARPAAPSTTSQPGAPRGCPVALQHPKCLTLARAQLPVGLGGCVSASPEGPLGDHGLCCGGGWSTTGMAGFRCPFTRFTPRLLRSLERHYQHLAAGFTERRQQPAATPACQPPESRSANPSGQQNFAARSLEAPCSSFPR